MQNKSFIHKAQKDWDSTDGHDTNEKNRIALILREPTLRHFPLFDQVIFIHKTNFKLKMKQPTGYKSKEDLWGDWETFKPDMFFPLKNLIIEIDGEWHFNTEKGVKQTKKRNQYYEYAGVRFFWYYTPDLKKMTDEELRQDLIKKLT